MFDETRQYFAKLGLPEGDLWDLPTSTATFPDGTHFRIEIPTINTAEAAIALLKRAGELGVTINRVTETYGMFRHTREEIEEYIAATRDYGAELVMSTGPRATYDTSATVLSPQGVRIGYRLRGMEQLARAVEDIKRGVELGVRGFLIYDEGMLWVVTQMRRDGELPPDVIFKVSAHCGHSNPAAFKFLEEMGADSINPVRDLQLPMIAALRAAVSTPIDCHTDNPPASGGFVRTYEAPEIARVAAPVHLKTGNSVVAGHGQLTTAENGRRMAEQASLVVEMVQRYYPEARQTEPGSDDLHISGG
jgi:hypothetical protein